MEKIETNSVVGPKKRGRKPGSKNKVKSKRASKKVAYLSAFALLEQEIQSLSNALKKATAQAEKEIEKLERKQAKDIEKVKANAAKSLALWKDRAKKNRLKSMSKGTGKRGNAMSPAAIRQMLDASGLGHKITVEQIQSLVQGSTT